MDDGVVIPGPGEAHTPVILLVEDDVLVRLMTGDILRDGGYEVIEAVDASEALTIMRTGHPLNLVVTDIRMPGPIDGVELTAIVKDMRPNMPVAILSSHMTEDVTHKADLFLVKPYNPDQLLEAIHELVGPEWLMRRASPSAS